MCLTQHAHHTAQHATKEAQQLKRHGGEQTVNLRRSRVWVVNVHAFFRQCFITRAWGGRHSPPLYFCLTGIHPGLHPGLDDYV